jgi:hypothetical protein
MDSCGGNVSNSLRFPPGDVLITIFFYFCGASVFLCTLSQAAGPKYFITERNAEEATLLVQGE